ncbi:unnamed protein product, partial [Brenthis ino]
MPRLLESEITKYLETLEDSEDGLDGSDSKVEDEGHYYQTSRDVLRDLENSDKAGNASASPAVLQMSMGGGDHFPSDVRLLPENQAYFDLNQCRSLDLKLINAKSKLPLKNKETENINPYERPVPSTSGTSKVIKRKTQIQTKKRKLDYDSDEENEDNYSLRDTSDEEIVMSEDEDMALCAILKHSKKYETDYYISNTLQVLDINDNNTNLNNETSLSKIKDLHSKIDETNISERKNIDINSKKIVVILDTDEKEINENEKAENFLVFNMGEIETKENECINDHQKKEGINSNLNNIGTKERADNIGVNSTNEQIKINEKTDKQYKEKNTSIDFNMDKIKTFGTEKINKHKKQGSVKETENLDLNQNEEIDNIHEKKQEVISEIHENEKGTIFYENQSVLVRYTPRQKYNPAP